MSKKLKPDTASGKPKWQIFGALPEIKGPIITICGNREASVDGCRGVIDYHDDRIKLRITGGSVTFLGSGLCISAFSESSAVISGNLQNIEFSVM